MKKMLKQYGVHLAVLTMLGGIAIGSMTQRTQVRDNALRPHTTAEFHSTSAMITTVAEDSGGSGVILTSTEEASTIMTNKHVCEVIQTGGKVITNGKSYKIAAYKIYTKHDLCMVKVEANLGINTVVAKADALQYSHAYVSGHPSLLPHVLTEGYFGSKKVVEIMVGFKECTGAPDENPLACIFMGGMPIIKKFNGQLVTATIMPGSSGSGVFNSEGEISGLVFAGAAEGLSYALIVPLAYVRDFVANKDQYEWKHPFRTSNQRFFAEIQSRIRVACASNSFFSTMCQ